MSILNAFHHFLAQTVGTGVSAAPASASADIALIGAISAITVGVLATIGVFVTNGRAKTAQGISDETARRLSECEERVARLITWAEQMDQMLSNTPDRVTLGSIRAKLPRRPVF